MSTSREQMSPVGRAGAPPAPLRRLTFELFAVVALKITALMLIWWIAFAPHSKPDASADAIAHRLAPSSSIQPADHP